MNICCTSKLLLKFFRAAGDSHRQKILALLKERNSLNATEIMKKIKLSQPTTSHHLSLLEEAGILIAQKKGKEVLYSLNPKTISSCCLGFMNDLVS